MRSLLSMIAVAVLGLAAAFSTAVAPVNAQTVDIWNGLNSDENFSVNSVFKKHDWTEKTATGYSSLDLVNNHLNNRFRPEANPLKTKIEEMTGADWVFRLPYGVYYYNGEIYTYTTNDRLNRLTKSGRIHEAGLMTATVNFDTSKGTLAMTSVQWYLPETAFDVDTSLGSTHWNRTKTDANGVRTENDEGDWIVTPLEFKNYGGGKYADGDLEKIAFAVTDVKGQFTIGDRLGILFGVNETKKVREAFDDVYATDIAGDATVHKDDILDVIGFKLLDDLPQGKFHYRGSATLNKEAIDVATVVERGTMNAELEFSGNFPAAFVEFDFPSYRSNRAEVWLNTSSNMYEGLDPTGGEYFADANMALQWGPFVLQSKTGGENQAGSITSLKSNISEMQARFTAGDFVGAGRAANVTKSVNASN